MSSLLTPFAVLSRDPGAQIRVGQTHIYIYTVCIRYSLAGKSPNIQSGTVHIYGSGQPFSLCLGLQRLSTSASLTMCSNSVALTTTPPQHLPPCAQIPWPSPPLHLDTFHHVLKFLGFLHHHSTWLSAPPADLLWCMKITPAIFPSGVSGCELAQCVLGRPRDSQACHH